MVLMMWYLTSRTTLHPISGYGSAYFEARTWNLNPALDVSTSWSSAHGRLQITPAGDGVLVYWGGSTNELSDTLYYDTEIDGYTNRQSAVVRFCDWNGGTGSCYYESDPKSLIIQTFLMYGYSGEARRDIPLESVLGLIRDDSAPSGSRRSWAAIGFRGHQMHGVTQ